jgi:hypothetical protein
VYLTEQTDTPGLETVRAQLEELKLPVEPVERFTVPVGAVWLEEVSETVRPQLVDALTTTDDGEHVREVIVPWSVTARLNVP